MDPDRRLLWLKRLAVLSVALTIALMSLGAWVKANSAGGSCPDWPACYGRYLPPFPSRDNGGLYQGQPVGYTQAQETYEWAHRAVVSLLFWPVLAFAVLAIRGKDLHPRLRQLAVSALLLYVIQALLGAITVLVTPGVEPPAWAATAHLFTATVFLTVLTSAAVWSHLKPLADRKPEAAAEPAKPRIVSYVYRDESTSATLPPIAAEAEAHDG